MTGLIGAVGINCNYHFSGGVVMGSLRANLLEVKYRE